MATDYTPIGPVPSGIANGTVDSTSKQLARDMRGKAYGKDVRETIARMTEWHSIRSSAAEVLAAQSAASAKQSAQEVTQNAQGAIKLFNDAIRQQSQKIDNMVVDLTDKDINSAPEIVAARRGKASLGAKIDEIDFGKLDKNKGAVTSADLSQEVKEQMTGGSVAVVGQNAILEENIVDGQVTLDKLSNTKKSTNLFNPDAGIKGIIPNPWSGGDVVSETDSSTEYIKIEGGKEYYLSVGKNTSFYDKDKTFISGISGTKSQHVVTAPDNARFLRTGFSGSGRTLQINEGNEALPFEPYRHVIDNRNIETNFMEIQGFILSNKGWTNVNTIDKQIEVTFNPNVVVGNEVYGINSGNYSFGHIENSNIVVLLDTKNKTIKFTAVTDVSTIEIEHTVIGYFRIDQNVYHLNGNYQVDKADMHGKNKTAHLIGQSNAFNVDLDNDKIIVRGAGNLILCGGEYYLASSAEIEIPDRISNHIYFDINNNSISLKSSDEIKGGLKNSEYFLGTIRQNSYSDGGASVYVNGNHQVNGSGATTFTEQDKRLVELGGRERQFFIPQTHEKYSPKTEFVEFDDNTSHVEVLSIYDDLHSRFPEYIKRTVLNQDSIGNDLVVYEFIPPKPKSYDVYDLPTIYYQSGIHGHEKGNPIAGALFFKELCEDWKTNEVLEMLRWNVRFIVFPVVNPSGYDLSTMGNANGVNLNGNFPEGFSTRSDVEFGEDRYPGEYPLSEIETQTIIKIWDENPDIDFSVDHHNSGATPAQLDEHYVYWIGSNNPTIKKIATSLVNEVNAYVKTNFDVNQLNNLGMVSAVSGGTVTRQREARGEFGVLYETSDMMNNSPEETQQMTMFALGNMFEGVLRNYHWL